MIDRRNFMQQTAGLAGVAALGLPALASHSYAPRNIKKAVKLGMVRTEGTLQEKFQLLLDLGYHGVELDSPNDLDKDEVIAARDATGIDIHGVVCSRHWGSPLSSPDPKVRAHCVKGIEVAIMDAFAYGATTVLLVPAVVNKEISYADAWDRSIREIKTVLPGARKMGITIAFENVWNQFLLSPLEAARYVDQFDSKSVGWYFDVGNIVNYGWPEQWIRILGNRIVKLDIKEYSRQKRDDEGLWKGFSVKLLEGDCDWPAVMAALDDIGYSGWATAEVGGGDAERLKDISERMDRILVS